MTRNTQTYVAFAGFGGDYVGWTSLDNYHKNVAAFLREGDVEHILSFEGPPYVTDGLSEAEVDDLFARLTTMAKNVVERRKVRA